MDANRRRWQRAQTTGLSVLGSSASKAVIPDRPYLSPNASWVISNRKGIHFNGGQLFPQPIMTGPYAPNHVGGVTDLTVDGFNVARVNVKDCVLDGITCGAAEFGDTTVPPHYVRNGTFADVNIDNCGREALGITGPTSGCAWTRVTTTHCDWSCALEIDQPGGQVCVSLSRGCKLYMAGVDIRTETQPAVMRVGARDYLFDDLTGNYSITLGL